MTSKKAAIMVKAKKKAMSTMEMCLMEKEEIEFQEGKERKLLELLMDSIVELLDSNKIFKVEIWMEIRDPTKIMEDLALTSSRTLEMKMILLVANLQEILIIRRKELVRLAFLILQSLQDKVLQSEGEPHLMKKESMAASNNKRAREEETDNKTSNTPMLLGMPLEVAEAAICKIRGIHVIAAEGSREAISSIFCNRILLPSQLLQPINCSIHCMETCKAVLLVAWLLAVEV